MDIRRDGWFGQLVVSGVGKPTAHRGSIMHIVAESLKDLGATRARGNADGESEILIRIRNKPFDTSKESASQFDKAGEVAAMVESLPTDSGPRDDEDYEAFHDRLISEGYTSSAALLIAAEWFERDADGLTIAWLNDPKAIRFRELNTRAEAFEAAIPQEYEMLKHYVISTYPSFTEHLTFRTA